MDPAIEIPQKPNPSTYNLVVLGFMNPAIHHPQWYQSVGILSEAEREFALLPTSMPIATPEISQFRTPQFTVVCQSQRWEIQWFAPEHASRCKELANKVFEVLFHTPVKAFGLNYLRHIPTSVTRVAALLARIVGATPLGLPTGGTSAKCTYSIQTKEMNTNIAIEPSALGEKFVYVGVNFHFPILASGSHFDLSPLITSAFEKCTPKSEEYLALVLASLKE